MQRIRIALALLLAASVSLAEDLLTASGARLADFRVTFHADRVQRDSHEALVKSYHTLARNQAAVAGRFRELFRREHLAVLKRYYDARLAAAQGELYTQARTREAERANRPFLSEIKTDKFSEGYRIVAILDRIRGKAVARKLGIPRKLPATDWPNTAIAEPDAATPEGTLGLLQRDMRALRAARVKARAAFDAVFFEIVGTFYGADRAKKAAKEQATAPAQTPPIFKLLDLADSGAAARYQLDILERVPGGDQLSAIGAMSFELARQGEHWRVVRERQRRTPKGEFEDMKRNFGLIFLLR